MVRVQPKEVPPELEAALVGIHPTSGTHRVAQKHVGFAPGERIAGKYRVERQIAMGGMGIVYACKDLMLDRPAAVKIILPHLIEDASIQARFYQEARTLARLDTRHVARVFECGYTECGKPYIAMELLEGIDLFRMLCRHGPLPPARVARMALQACRGLKQVHALGIVHRDIKPENLFVTRSRSGADLIKVLDFGISKQHLRDGRSLTNPTVSVGSPHYMSPEQIRTPSVVDGRADIWSLGVVMYELLTGKLPFQGSSNTNLCKAVMSEPVPPPGSDVPEGLSAIVMRCMERNLEERFANVDQLAHALETLLAVPGALESEPPAALPSVIVRSERRTRSTQASATRRKRLQHQQLILGVAAGLLLAAACGTGASIAVHVSKFRPELTPLTQNPSLTERR